MFSHEFPYRIPIEKMQADRLHNLGSALLRLDLTEEHNRQLAQVSEQGCIDALLLGDTEAALAFARHWLRYDTAAQATQAIETVAVATAQTS